MATALNLKSLFEGVQIDLPQPESLFFVDEQHVRLKPMIEQSRAAVS